MWIRTNTPQCVFSHKCYILHQENASSTFPDDCYEMYTELCRLHERGFVTRVTKTKEVMQYYGIVLGDRCRTVFFKQYCKQTVQDKFVNYWTSEIQNFSKDPTYQVLQQSQDCLLHASVSPYHFWYSLSYRPDETWEKFSYNWNWAKTIYIYIYIYMDIQKYISLLIVNYTKNIEIFLLFWWKPLTPFILVWFGKYVSN